MPRVSARAKILRELRTRLERRLFAHVFRWLMALEDEYEDDIDILTLALYNFVSRQRYFERGPYRSSPITAQIFGHDLQEGDDIALSTKV